jgi:hypothetical protein
MSDEPYTYEVRADQAIRTSNQYNLDINTSQNNKLDLNHNTNNSNNIDFQIRSKNSNDWVFSNLKTLTTGHFGINPLSLNYLSNSLMSKSRNYKSNNLNSLSQFKIKDSHNSNHNNNSNNSASNNKKNVKRLSGNHHARSVFENKNKKTNECKIIFKYHFVTFL